MRLWLLIGNGQQTEAHREKRGIGKRGIGFVAVFVFVGLDLSFITSRLCLLSLEV